MKHVLALAFLCVSLTTYAEEIKVSNMSPDGELERSYVLSTSLDQVVVLDCQSFIQGLRIGEREEAMVFILEPYECEAMQERVRGSLNRKQFHCIDVDQDIRSDYTCS